jgi:hypothetical protein
MSLNISDKQFATIWQVEDKQTYASVRMSTSRKDKRDDTYKNSNWSFVRFVGDAYKKVIGLPEKTRIQIKGGTVSWESYTDSTGAKVFAKTPQITIFNFEVQESNQQTLGLDTPPAVVPEETDEMPF